MRKYTFNCGRWKAFELFRSRFMCLGPFSFNWCKIFWEVLLCIIDKVNWTDRHILSSQGAVWPKCCCRYQKGRGPVWRWFLRRGPRSVTSWSASCNSAGTRIPRWGPYSQVPTSNIIILKKLKKIVLGSCVLHAFIQFMPVKLQQIRRWHLSCAGPASLYIYQNSMCFPFVSIWKPREE